MCDRLTDEHDRGVGELIGDDVQEHLGAERFLVRTSLASLGAKGTLPELDDREPILEEEGHSG